MSIRAEKVASTVKRLLAQHITDISREIKAGFATLTSVKMTSDLHLVKCYVSLFGKETQPGLLLEELERRKHLFKHLIAKEMRLRTIPDFKFYYDDTLDQIDHIKDLINSSKTGNADLFNESSDK
ncbi:MAG: 30S ribosome-binding factor RbfA [Candidatus Kapabacteria bacterium]|nr:30S ribosome-binding factor RbfA [Candidatus Kapabacteria bacterium]